MSNNIELISIDELCEMLGCGYNSAYRLLNEHKIPAFRIGKNWKIPKEGVIKFILEESGLVPKKPFTFLNAD